MHATPVIKEPLQKLGTAPVIKAQRQLLLPSKMMSTTSELWTLRRPKSLHPNYVKTVFTKRLRSVATTRLCLRIRI
jgi:hypothetical protein